MMLNELKKENKKLAVIANRLKKEHSIIIKESSYFEKCLVRIGKNLDAVKNF